MGWASRVLVPLLLLCAAACGPLVDAGRPDIVSAHVTAVIENGDHAPAASVPQPFQRVSVQLDDSLYRGETVALEWRGHRSLDENGFLRPGDRVLLSVTRSGNDRTYAILEVVRLPSLLPIAVLLVAALIVVARLTGLAALAGLGASVAIVVLAIVPAVRRGDDPLVAAVVGSLAATVVLALAVRGLCRDSFVALCGAMGGLGVVTGAGAVALASARMTGLATETQSLLAASTHLDMPRVALAAVIVASLGAVVDASAGQASAASSLAAADATLRGRRLFGATLRASRGHVGALVSVVGLSVVGGALPLILLVSVGTQPLAVWANSEEIVATLVTVAAAGLGVVLAAPVATAVAVMFAGAPPAET